jgi:hypothetical protein
MRFCPALNWFAIFGALLYGSAFAHASFGGTVGLWKFDTIADFDDSILLGRTHFDSSGNSLHLTESHNFGSLLLDDDVPSHAPAGSLSLESKFGGSSRPTTPSTDLFHRGKTGALSIEFWFNAQAFTTFVGYVAHFNAGGGGSAVPGDWGIYADSATGSLNFFEFGSGLSFSQVSAEVPALNSWHHYAFTLNNVGDMTAFRDGVQQQKILATGAAQPAVADVLKFHRGRDGGFDVHNFLIDDLRISDVALTPGSGNGVNQLAWNTSLSNAPSPPPRPANFGRNWVRENNFTINAWGYTQFPALYNQAGFNSSLGGGMNTATDNGLRVHHLGALTALDNTSRTDIHISINGGVKAFLLADEILPDQISGVAEVADYIRSIDSNTLLIAGLGSSGAAYIDQVVAEVKPDALIHAFYPFQGATNATDEWYAGGISDVALIRERALFHDLPYLAFVQSFDDQITSGNTPSDRYRLPTESELRAEVFSKLSAGVKGIYYFPFEDGTLEDIALVDPNGVPSALFQPVSLVNSEIAVLGESLRHLQSTDWRFQSGGIASTPASIEAMDANAGNGLIDSVAILGTPADRRDALIGYFTDDANGEYFMLVNTFHDDSLNAAGASVDFVVQFDSSVDSIWRLNRITGLVEELNLSNSLLNLSLAGGTGDLFKFGDGNFAGIVTATGDFDGDGDIDGRDFLMWQRGQSPNPNSSSDLALWQQTYGTSQLTAMSTNVPEPATAILLLLFGGFGLGKRRRS